MTEAEYSFYKACFRLKHFCLVDGDLDTLDRGIENGLSITLF